MSTADELLRDIEPLSHGERAAWSPPWRALLKRLRASPLADVAYRAGRVYTAIE